MNLNLSKVAGALSLLALSGCASFSPDGGFDRVASLTRERTGIAPIPLRDAEAANAARTRSTELLQQALTPDAAVEIALLNHRGLRASFAELGIAEADLVRAGRLHNPSLRFGRLAGGGNVEIDRAVIFDVLGLLAMPTASRIERDRFAHRARPLRTRPVAGRGRRGEPGRRGPARVLRRRRRAATAGLRRAGEGGRRRFR
jgi:hypothetical protein